MTSNSSVSGQQLGASVEPLKLNEEASNIYLQFEQQQQQQQQQQHLEVLQHEQQQIENQEPSSSDSSNSIKESKRNGHGRIFFADFLFLIRMHFGLFLFSKLRSKIKN